jgi:hypothetical protein
MPSHHMTKSALNPQFPDIPSVSLRLGSSTKDSLGYMNKYPFGLYDHYLHDGDKMLMKSHIEEYDDDIGDHPSSGCLDNPHHDFIGTEMKYDDVRGLHEGEDEFHDHSSHIDYSSERFFDDVFLQISPDYGCLV